MDNAAPNLSINAETLRDTLEFLEFYHKNPGFRQQFLQSLQYNVHDNQDLDRIKFKDKPLRTYIWALTQVSPEKDIKKVYRAITRASDNEQRIKDIESLFSEYQEASDSHKNFLKVFNQLQSQEQQAAKEQPPPPAAEPAAAETTPSSLQTQPAPRSLGEVGTATAPLPPEEEQARPAQTGPAPQTPEPPPNVEILALTSGHDQDPRFLKILSELKEQKVAELTQSDPGLLKDKRELDRKLSSYYGDGHVLDLTHHPVDDEAVRIFKTQFGKDHDLYTQQEATNTQTNLSHDVIYQQYNREFYKSFSQKYQKLAQTAKAQGVDLSSAEWKKQTKQLYQNERQRFLSEFVTRFPQKAEHYSHSNQQIADLLQQQTAAPPPPTTIQPSTLPPPSTPAPTLPPLNLPKTTPSISLPQPVQVKLPPVVSNLGTAAQIKGASALQKAVTGGENIAKGVGGGLLGLGKQGLNAGLSLPTLGKTFGSLSFGNAKLMGYLALGVILGVVVIFFMFFASNLLKNSALLGPTGVVTGSIGSSKPNSTDPVILSLSCPIAPGSDICRTDNGQEVKVSVSLTYNSPGSADIKITPNQPVSDFQLTQADKEGWAADFGKTITGISSKQTQTFTLSLKPLDSLKDVFKTLQLKADIINQTLPPTGVNGSTSFDALMAGQGRNTTVLGDEDSFVSKVMANKNRFGYEEASIRQIYQKAVASTVNPLLALTIWGVESSFTKSNLAFGYDPVHQTCPGFDQQLECSVNRLDFFMKQFDQVKDASGIAHIGSCAYSDPFLYAYEWYTPVCHASDSNEASRTNFVTFYNQLGK